MMEIEILIDFSPLDNAIGWVPIANMLWEFVAQISHDGMTLGKLKIILCVLYSWNFAHRIDFQIFL